MVDKINSTKMMFFSDKQEEEVEKDSRWTDVLYCMVTDVVIALFHLHGRAPLVNQQDPDDEEEEDLNVLPNIQLAVRGRIK